MQKLRFLLLALFTSFSFISSAQFTVYGTVLDSTTREPLGSASVFCQNTTLGTATNKQGEFSLQLKSGGYDLIFTYTGYQTQTIRITGDVTKFEILMIKEDKSLGEVVIKSSNEVKDGWEKYGSFFLENFVGSTPNAAQCVLQNPEVLKFYFLKKSNKLRVLATEPLQIANKALGYNLRYQLDSFVYFYNTDINSYRGYCLYSEMEGTDSLRRVWSSNRMKAYYGSKLQFMRSYYDSTLIEDGWNIDMLDETDHTKFNRVKNVYDTSVYSEVILYPEITVMTSPEAPDSLPVPKVILDSAHATMQVEFYYPRKISVTYTKKKPEPEYIKKFKLPKNVAVQISYIDMSDGIAIKENGYYYDQKDWINQGYWSWKNIADLLPYDYLPER
ncbi:MAG: carboxypeptidase-like regulatory domain-containing protein [Chitinophagaceae bacterium]|nr:carboxypeptidase-like regulatory domain-containing protein [Chitinophagaceae bacterium]